MIWSIATTFRSVESPCGAGRRRAAATASAFTFPVSVRTAGSERALSRFVLPPILNEGRQVGVDLPKGCEPFLDSLDTVFAVQSPRVPRPRDSARGHSSSRCCSQKLHGYLFARWHRRAMPGSKSLQQRNVRIRLPDVKARRQQDATVPEPRKLRAQERPSNTRKSAVPECCDSNRLAFHQTYRRVLWPAEQAAIAEAAPRKFGSGTRRKLSRVIRLPSAYYCRGRLYRAS